MRPILLITFLLCIPYITLAGCGREAELLSCEKTKKAILTKTYPTLKSISDKKIEYSKKRDKYYRQLKTRLELAKQKGEMSRVDRSRESSEYFSETKLRQLEFDIEFGDECLKVTGKINGIASQHENKLIQNRPATNKLKNTIIGTELVVDEKPDTSGKLEVVNYYKKLTGKNIIVYEYIRKLNIVNMSNIRRIKRGLNKELVAIPLGCYSEQCTNKRKRIYSEMKKNQEDYKRLVNENKRIGILNLHQILPLYSIYAAIELSCNRESRTMIFKDYSKKLVQTQFKRKHLTKEDFVKKNKLMNKSYLQTKQDIETGRFTVDCSWKILDERYSSVNYRFKRLK